LKLICLLFSISSSSDQVIGKNKIRKAYSQEGKIVFYPLNHYKDTLPCLSGFW